MSIDRSDFDSISEQDLQELIIAQVPEGFRLDYKLNAYGRADPDKRELAKDISAFANSHGGHLIIGVEETGGIATNILGIDGIDIDAEILRMEQITRSAIEPRITGIRIRAVPLTSGRKVLIARVPRSWNPPHRVTSQGSNRFYVRNSAGVHEPGIEELRVMFNQSASALEQARKFRDERIQVIKNGLEERPLNKKGRFLLHIIPVAAFSGMVNLNMEKVISKADSFSTLANTSYSPRFNYYGFINQMGGKDNLGYTQIFRNGILEATLAGFVHEFNEGKLSIPGLSIEKYIFKSFSKYIYGLRDIDVPPPLIIMLTFEGVKGVLYSVESSYSSYNYLLPEDIITLPECILEDYGAKIDHHRAVRPAFDALWNAVGYACSQYFNEDGLWVGEQK